MSHFIFGLLAGLVILLYSYLIAYCVARGWRAGMD